MIMDAHELQAILGQLKDFQRNTVEYVFRRMYLDGEPARRFLVADEVGLGKTMVARGIIARALHHLRDRRRVNVVYICSNATIAEQNINRLNVLGLEEIALPTRLTLLPVQAQRLAGNRVNFVSFTPGTTFDLKSRGGKMQERAVLLRLLRTAIPQRGRALFNLLQCTASDAGWAWAVECSRAPIDAHIQARFTDRLRAHATLPARLEAACERFVRHRRNVHGDDSSLRYATIGELRHLLAEVCVEALQPDLVILDEFQRFKDLLSGESAAADLARSLFTYQSGHGDDVRVLLLSATPYRMLSLNRDSDDHYADFLKTLAFLFDDPSMVAATEAALRDYRTELYGVGPGGEEVLRRARDRVQNLLRRVISRTERTSATVAQDAMLVEPPVPTRLAPGDLSQALIADRVAAAVGARDPIEYWKSAPYLLSFMKGYEMRHRLQALQEQPPEDLVAMLRERRGSLLRRVDFQRYRPLEPCNARLRALIAETVDAGQWRLLWIPPSLPYLQPGGAYRELSGTTKALIFSSWNLVPDAIAALCSYEAERRMLGEDEPNRPRYGELTRKRRALLRFGVDPEGRSTGMPTLALLYPCVSLAAAVDPLRIALEDDAEGEPVDVEAARVRVRAVVEELLRGTGRWPGVAEGPEDQSWYWAALALMDSGVESRVRTWARRSDGWLSAGAGSEEDRQSGFGQHVERFADALAGRVPLGRAPGDLPDVLADFALGSPAICAHGRWHGRRRGWRWMILCC